jgi:hypothetical protein
VYDKQCGTAIQIGNIVTTSLIITPLMQTVLGCRSCSDLPTRNANTGSSQIRLRLREPPAKQQNEGVIQMIGRKASVGMALLWALVFCAFSASSAWAIKGTTAFTCVANVEKVAGFEDEHCTKTQASPAKFKHVAIAENTTTKTHITNERTNATTTGPTVWSLTAKEQPLVGEAEIQCKKVLGHGELTNDKNETTKEHTIHVTKITYHYAECSFIKPNFCKVKGGTILVEGITATSAGEEDALLFKPEVGTTFTIIEAEGFGCPTKLPVEGSVRAKENGATIEFTEAEITAEKTLTINGKPAATSGKTTVRSADTTTKLTDAYKETGTPISSTTVET